MASDACVRLAELVPEENIIPELKATGKEAAVKELVRKLAASGVVAGRQVRHVTGAVLERERLGSTGIGNGIAVPHAKFAGIKDAVGAFGRSTKGIDFASLDGAITHSIFLFLSPAEFPDKHIKLMSRFVTLMRKGDFVKFLRQTEGRKALHDFLKEVDEW
jgi:PTS system nitrogen regulatory IIA component